MHCLTSMRPPVLLATGYHAEQTYTEMTSGLARDFSDVLEIHRCSVHMRDFVKDKVVER